MGYEGIKYVAGKIPEDKRWVLTALSESDVVYVKEFSWGQKIDLFPEGFMKPDDESHVVGIVLRGVCEVYHYDTIGASDPIYCHRPIRILECGDVFNDFEFVDRAVLEKKLTDDARKGEDWELSSGISSMIAIAPDEEAHRSEEGSEENSKNKGKIRILTSDYTGDDSRFNNTINGFIRDKNKSNKSEIAYFKVKVKLGDHNRNFQFHMLKNAWKRVLTYRESPNSYNIGKRSAFINKCNTVVGDESKTHKKGSSKSIAPYRATIHNVTITPIFVEAIYDALNRIDRHEPLFIWAPQSYYSADFSNTPVKCLVAKRIRADDDVFYFPICLANHIVCSYAKQNLNTEYNILEGFGKGPPRAARKNSDMAYSGKDPKNVEYKGSNKHYWMDTAQEIIKIWEKSYKLDNSVEFPYRLSVEVLSNENRQWLLFVKFEKKQVQSL